MAAMTSEQLPDPPTDAGAIINATERLAGVEVVPTPEGDRPLLIVLPKGKTAHPAKPFLDALRERPERRKGTATLLDLESFILHAKRFAHADRSAIFAVRDPKAPKLVTVVDYHDTGHAGQPSHLEHRGVYAFPLSEEWQRWSGANKQSMGQAQFAEFIESNLLELLPPDQAGPSAKDFAARLGVEFATPQRLAEVSRGLSIRVNEKVASAVSLQSGEIQLQYTAQHSDESGAPIKVPSAFLIGLPVFRRGEVFQVAARLRYRVKEGVTSWWYELWRADVVFDTAVEDAAKKAQEETGLPLFFGSPES